MLYRSRGPAFAQRAMVAESKCVPGGRMNAHRTGNYSTVRAVHCAECMGKHVSDT